MDLRGARPCEGRADRVALVRHRRRAARRRLGDLADLGLGEQDRRRARSFRARRRRRRARRRARRSACGSCATAAPARRGPSSRRVETEHLGPCVAERGERPGGAAELRRQLDRREAHVPRRAAPTSQPAALQAEGVGTACWSSVRPVAGVERCGARAPLRPRPRRPARRRSAGAPSARRASPRCRRCPGSSRRGERTARRRRRPPRVARARAARPGCRRRGRSAASCSQVVELRPARSAIAAAAAAGITPASDSAFASARSASSIASSQARSDTASRSAAGTNRGRTRSKREEDRLPVALHADVEAERVAVALGDERRAILDGERREHRVGVVGRRRGSTSASAAA